MSEHWYYNMADAVVGLTQLLLEDAPEVACRGDQRTTELTAVSFTIEMPEQRLHVLPHRNANPFAMVAEMHWVLAGRNDIEWLSYYLPRAADFSDDGKTWRAGYGPRLRAFEGVYGLGETGGIDQIKGLYEELKQHPESRRAVISLWDPAADLHIDSKDIPCLAGETTLWSPEGDLPISEVAAKFQSGGVSRWPVYSVDPKTLAMRLDWATNVWQSGVKDTIKLTFDDGSTLRVTPDHRLYRKYRKHLPGTAQQASHTVAEECLAGKLRVGDRVLATHRRYGLKGHEIHKRRLNWGTALDNRQLVHREYAEMLYGSIPEDYDVHHLNGVKTDNRAENLQLLPHGSHAAITMRNQGNPMLRLTPEEHKTRANKQSESLRQNWTTQTDERRQKQRESMLRAQATRAEQQRQLKDNHIVVSIEPGGVVPVYDFTVPEFHTAVVGTGVVAHNCNNWLQFLIRDGMLHMHVVARSLDLFWGFSAINCFTWSVLQEVLANSLGLKMGSMTWFVGSLHLYERHWERSRKMLNAVWDSPKVPRDFGIASPSIKNVTVETLDDELAHFFEWETAFRSNNKPYGNIVSPHADPFFSSCIQTIKLYHQATTDAIRLLPDGWRQVVEEYDARHTREPVKSTTTSTVKSVTPFDVASSLVELQAQKAKSYGDSWKKHGELLSIFPNITRKIDRLQTGNITADETRMDTLADTCVYSMLYLTWLAERYPEATVNVVRETTTHIDNFNFTGIAGWVLEKARDWRVDMEHDWIALLYDNFAALERLLTDESMPSRAILQEVKIGWVLNMAVGALMELVTLANTDPLEYDGWAKQWEDK